MIEKQLDIPFIADLALREKQIQQNYRPVIAVHKWFARRPGTLFRGLLLSEFSGKPLQEVFYKSNDLSGCRVADPFMGGGTPILEAKDLGCDVHSISTRCPAGSLNRKSSILILALMQKQRRSSKMVKHLRCIMLYNPLNRRRQLR